MDCSTPGFSIHHWLPELTQTHVHLFSDAIQPCHVLLSPSPPAFNLLQDQGLFQWVSSLHQVAKVLEFQLQHQSFQWIFRLISFRKDWLYLLTVQETLENLLQHHSSKASILLLSAFFFLICSEFCHTLKWNSHGFTCVPHPDPLPPPSPPAPSRSSQCTRSKHLSHASNLGWWSVSP